MSLTEEERINIVKFRLDKAKDTFTDFLIMVENQRYNSAANRLYYVCFYAVTALLINDGHEAHTHKGVKKLLNWHYIKENKIEESFGKMYERLFNMRQKGDYEDWFVIEEQNIIQHVEPVKNFIAVIEHLIYNHND